LWGNHADAHPISTAIEGGEATDEEIDQRTWEPAMSLCAQCAQPTLTERDLCVHHLHLYPHADDWAAGNRIMCNFVHRGIMLPATRERSDALEPLVESLDEALIA
jgi:hypothetical protein